MVYFQISKAIFKIQEPQKVSVGMAVFRQDMLYE